MCIYARSRSLTLCLCLSSQFADRIKIARKGRGVDLNMAIQFILNCGTEVAGSCHGPCHMLSQAAHIYSSPSYNTTIALALGMRFLAD